MSELNLFLLLNLFFFIYFFILFKTSFKINLLDFPNNRKFITKPIPTIGGLLIYFSL